jgi:hypothetical protein
VEVYLMPVDKFVSLATTIVLGTMIAQSLGNPSIFKPHHLHARQLGQGNGQKSARDSGHSLVVVLETLLFPRKHRSQQGQIKAI